MSFKDDYLRLKQENLNDEEIREELLLGSYKFHQLKRIHGLVKNGIPKVKKPKKNTLGFTEEELQQGERIGLSRRLMYKRFREYNWSREKAISEPRQIKRNKRRVIE